MRSALSALLLACTAPGLLVAQARDTLKVDSTGVGRTYRVEGVTVRVARPALTTGGSSAVVINLDSLGSIPAPTMEQVLRQMPLIQIRTNSRGEAQPALRGSDDRQVAVIMDGIPLTLGWDHRTDLSIIPLTAARNIKLVRGLSSVLYGPNTLGGVVEVDVARTRQRISQVDPVAVGFGLDETGGTNISATGGGIVEGAFSQWVIRGGAGFQDRAGMPVPSSAADESTLQNRFLADDGLRLNSDARRLDGFLSARYRSDEGAWASLSASGYDVERGVPPEAHQDSPRLWRYPEQRRIIAALSGGTGQRTTPWGTGDLEASLGVDDGRYRIDQFTSEAYQTVEEVEEGDDGALTLRLLGDHTLGSTGEIRAALTYADVRHDEVLTPGGSNGFRQRLWSFGTETEWRLGAQGSTRLTLGMAIDGADTPESGDKPSLEALTDYGFRAGVSSLVSQGLLVHGGISRRARFPSLRELYSGALGRFEPNPALRSEALLGAELGLTANGGGSEVQAVLFHHRLADGIVRSSIVDAEGNRRFKRVNKDQIKGTGFELLAVTSVGAAMVSGDLTLQRVRGYDADGSAVDLEYEPAVAGKAGIELPLVWDLRGSADFRYMGEQRCENPEAGGLQPLASSQSLDLSLRRVFRSVSNVFGNVDATVRVNNVTDALAFDQCGLPQPGRTVQLQVRLW